jgi:UDP-N-acetylglucosamine 2-epimerase
MKVVSVVGARPQFIKAAPIDAVLRRDHEHVLIHTGQHYDDAMSRVFFEALAIPAPKRNLDVGSGRHGWQTGEMLRGLEPVLQEEKPDVVLTYGDTNSTLAAALAAAKLGLSAGHVEAGLRSYNRAMPEETNRIVADRLSDVLFCPTETAVANLEKEGIREGVHRVGDVMLDVALRHADDARRRDAPSRFGVAKGAYLLLTLHRPSNADDEGRLATILKALDEGEEDVVFPVHPRTAARIEKGGLAEGLSPRLRLVEPVSYPDFLSLLLGARKVLTDSGGVQKEAYFFGVPCITLREETEWTETVEDGWNVLVGADPDQIRRAVTTFAPSGRRRDRFGDGHAAEAIERVLASTFAG